MLPGDSQLFVNAALTKLPAFECLSPDLCISWLFVFPFTTSVCISNSNSPLFTKVDKSYISGTCQVHQLPLACAVMDLYLHRSGLCLHDLPCYSTPVGCALAISRPCPTSDKYETDPPPHNTLRSHTHRSHSKWGKGIFLEEDFIRRGFL